MKKMYVAPCARVTNVKFEGMIAASDVSGDNPGGQSNPSNPVYEDAKEDMEFDW